MTIEINDYRHLIRRALAQKCARNPKYSMRAFARRAGVSPSHLSRIMNGGVGISTKMAYKIAGEMGLSNEETQMFINLVNIESLDENVRHSLSTRRQELQILKMSRRILEMDQFEVVADWYHLPIFEFVRCRPRKSRPSILAKKFKISLAEAKAALDRLERIGAIRKMQDGFYVANNESSLQTSNDIPSLAIRKHHKQMSEKAITALAEDMDKREFQGLHLVFDPKDMLKVRKRIREFIDQFDKEFSSETGENVYQLNLQFFSLTDSD